MSRVLWWDCSAGAAGDMLLGALLDAGADADAVRAGLGALGREGWALEPREVQRGAFRALQAGVTVTAQPAHAHGHWAEVRALLQHAALPERVRQRSLAVYGRLAEVEAALHGVPVDDIVLHEVGALDAIVDIVGTSLALEDLGVDRIVATPLPLGQGTVSAAHGPLPLPAPATLALVQGWPVVPAGRTGEQVTPTGAALVTTLAEPGPLPAMVPEAVGHGAGARDPDGLANLVRAVVGRPQPGAGLQPVVELAATIDDGLPEHVPPAVAALLEAGALDAWTTPATTKHGRPGWVLHALVHPPDADRLSDWVLRHTSTLGVRRQAWQRAVLDRWHVTVQTAYGPVRVKVGGRDGQAWHAAPEHADVAARAAQAGVPLPEVYSAALAAWRATD